MSTFHGRMKAALAAFAAVALTLPQAFAATTGTLTLSGVVPAATAISVSPVAGYNSLDLTSTATDLLVANVSEVNNTALGYKVTLTSSNLGGLKNGTVGNVTYTAKYNSVAVDLTAANVVITNSGATTSVVSTSKPFKISYTGQAAANLMQGTYTDTLTFTVASN